MNDEAALQAFAALANADRLTIMKQLVEAGPAGMTAGEIATKAGASPSRASFHLATLSQAGLVNATRRSRSMTYRAAFEHLGALVSFLLEDCCKSHPVVTACCGVPRTPS